MKSDTPQQTLQRTPSFTSILRMDKNKSCFYKDCRNSSTSVFSWLVVSCFWYILVEVNFPFLHPIWAEGSREAPIITYLCVYFFSRQRTEMHRFLSFIIVFVCHWCVGIKWSSEFKTVTTAIFVRKSSTVRAKTIRNIITRAKNRSSNLIFTGNDDH